MIESEVQSDVVCSVSFTGISDFYSIFCSKNDAENRKKRWKTAEKAEKSAVFAAVLQWLRDASADAAAIGSVSVALCLVLLTDMLFIVQQDAPPLPQVLAGGLGVTVFSLLHLFLAFISFF